MADSLGWQVRKARSPQRLSNRDVVQRGTPGLLDLSVCLVAGTPQPLGGLSLLGSLVAASTSEGIRRDTGVVSWLHWPNLVTIDGRVVAKTSLGISPTPRPMRKTEVVARIVVDCFAHPPGPFSLEGLSSTSILEALGVEIDVDMLRGKILHALNWYHAEWERGMNQKLVDRIQPTIAWVGRPVEVLTTKGKRVSGKAVGLDDLGSLLLVQRDGRGNSDILEIRAETVDRIVVG